MEAAEHDEVITLNEMIEEQERAIALMGSASSSVCSYPQVSVTHYIMGKFKTIGRVVINKC